MKKFTFIYLLFFCFSVINSFAQSCFFANGFPGLGTDLPGKLVVDPENNVIVTSIINPAVDIDPGPAVVNLASSSVQSYIAKYSNTGSLIWAKKASGSQFIIVEEIAVDAAGNILSCGTFSGTVDFDPATNTAYKTGNNTPFLWKLDKNGNFINVMQFEGFGLSPQDIKIDNAGNIYLTGFFNQQVDFQPEFGVHNMTPVGKDDAFIVKYNSNYALQWAVKFGGPELDAAIYLELDNQNDIYVTGYFSGQADLDPGTGQTLYTGGSNSAFVSKFSNSGTFIYGKGFTPGVAGSFSSSAIAVDASKNVYMSGSYYGTSDFDPGTGVFNMSTASGISHAFMVKLDPTGTFSWAKQLNGAVSSFISLSRYDKAGNILMVGRSFGKLDMDPGPDSVFLDTVNNVFFLKVDPSGNFVSAKTVTASDVTGVDIDASNNIFVAGAYDNASSDLNPDPKAVSILPFVSGREMYMMKFPSLFSYPETITHIPCKGSATGSISILVTEGKTPLAYSWNSNPVQSTTTLQNVPAGIYTFTLTDGNSCTWENTAEIKEPDQVLFVDAVKTDVSCIPNAKDGTATVSVSGGATPYNISWNTNPVMLSPAISNLGVGQYIVRVADANNCIKFDTVDIIKENNPSQFTYNKNGMVVSFSISGSGCNTFKWDFGNGNTSDLNANPTVTYSTAGTYSVCLRCNDQPLQCVKCVDITVPGTGGGGTTSIQSINENGISVFPNPIVNSFNVLIPQSKTGAEFLLYNSLGNEVINETLIFSENSISKGNLSPGIYHYRIIQNDLTISRGSIVVR